MIDQPSWQLTAVTNYRLNDNNGFENAYSDVIKHEFGHYLANNAIGYNLGAFHENEYGRSPHSSSIDEGLADYLACPDNDDPILGGGVLASLGFERDLEDTSKRCPEDVVGEPHADGEIVGSLSWSVRSLFGKAIADDPRKGDNVELSSTGPGLIPLPEPAVFDLEVPVDAASGEVLLDGADFEAGAEYFFALVNRGCPDLRFTVSTSTEDEPVPTTSSSTTAVTTASATTGSGTTKQDEQCRDDRRRRRRRRESRRRRPRPRRR